jgi:DNA primase
LRMLSPAARASLESKVTEAEANLAGALPYLESRGITEDTARRFRLGYLDGKLVIPYLSPAGPWHCKYRCISDHNCKDVGHGKYTYDSGAEHHLYNAQTLLTATGVIVTEGEIDAITAEQHDLPAVAYPGAETWAKYKFWRWCFDSVDEIVVVGDGDEPGRKAATSVSDSLRSSVTADVRMVVLPDGEDTNSFITKYGSGEYLAEIEWL